MAVAWLLEISTMMDYPTFIFTANNKSGNKLYLNKGNFEFEDITEKAKVGWHGRLVHWCDEADVNGDGLLDIMCLP